MSTPLRRMSNLVKDFVQRESRDEGVVGIVVFGSFVKGKVRGTSDLDFLVVKEDIEEYSRIKQKEKGILLEIHTWSLKLFGKPFDGELGNVFSDAFCFEVMRNGRILYDPKGILQQFKRYARTCRLPYSHIKSLAERAHKSLQLAENLFERRKLEGAEIEVRKAAEELARVLLLERDILEIIPPKIYLPHLREEVPKFYKTFLEVHNLENIQRNEIEAAIQSISNWRERTFEEIRRIGKEDWLKIGEAIHGAQTELSNAQDCLENDDLEAAMLQVRYSAMLVVSPILSLLKGSRKGTPVNTPSMRYMELLQSKHPFGNVVKSMMNFSHDKGKIKEHIEILENTAERYV